MIGIGGSGMSGIAEVLLNLGHRVSGSDIKHSAATKRLETLGASIHYGHDRKHVQDVDVVVYSSAVTKENPEVKAAEEKMIPLIPRAEMLAELMRMKYGIAVAGSHGKTTTTSLVATVLAEGGTDPTAIIGGKLNAYGSNAKLGQGDFLVAEADESDGSFLKLSPTITVLTNIDTDHLDYYRDLESLRSTFAEFINKVPFYGVSILCLDDVNVQNLIPRLKKRYITYGFNTQAEYQAKDLTFEGLQTRFQILHQGENIGEFVLKIPGIHNVQNALAAVAVGREVALGGEAIRRGIEAFKGIERRFQVHGEVDEIMVVDDYGHHPTEIKATLEAMKQVWQDRRVLVVYQPHRFTRTQILFNEFLTAFYQADHLVLTDIYPAGEHSIEGITSKALLQGIREHGHKSVIYLPDFGEVIKHLIDEARPGDVVLTLGAGDVWRVATDLVQRLRER